MLKRLDVYSQLCWKSRKTREFRNWNDTRNQFSAHPLSRQMHKFLLSHEKLFSGKLVDQSLSVHRQVIADKNFQLKMGMKVNLFLAFLLASAYFLWNSNVALLFVNLMGFTALYKNFKVWQFTSKFPGRNFSINFKSFFTNTAENFHRELNEMWMNLGRDKFITWVGFERFVAVSKLSDVKVRFSLFIMFVLFFVASFSSIRSAQLQFFHSLHSCCCHQFFSI